MNLFERVIVACFRAIDVWFSTVVGAPQVDVEQRLQYGDLGEPYEDDIDDETSVTRP